jgi:hypothetical protein
MNQTYLIRVVSYIVGSDQYRFHNTDDIYAMQVVKFDPDNIELVLWKKFYEGGAYKIK